jgi:SAM-dependent methyltransferase
MFEKQLLEMFYKKAASPEQLPWHRDEPPSLLVRAVQQKVRPGKALDLGCGTGVFSIYLAKQGYEVTGIDLVPKAIEWARERARNENQQITWVLANLLEWNPAQRFDLILDSACLQTFRSGSLEGYKKQLLSWAAPNADYILVHWGRRHPLDWRPIGPRRRTRPQLVQFLSPEFREEAYEQEVISGIPLPIGPSALGQCFWFRRVA